MMIKIHLISLLLILAFNTLFKTQQRILPLNTTVRDSIKAGDYLKDINNDYKPFVGDWKATFDNKIILLRIRKVLKKPSEEGFRENKRKYYEDVLVVQHAILDSIGNVIEDYFSPNLNIYKILSRKYNKSKRSALFFYSGVQCGAGAGSIELKMINPRHFTWSYTGVCGVWGGCPKDADLAVHIPMERGLIFAKQ